jgi:HK97 gp10 family phage protein
MNDIKVGNIQVDGLRALEEKLMQLPDRLAKNILQGAMREGAKVIKNRAVDYAPMSVEPHILRSYASAVFKKFETKKMGVWILPGNLKRMIRVKTDKTGSRGYKISYEVYVKNKEAWYWKFLEFGTSKKAAVNNGRGFLRPAFEDMKAFAVAAIEQKIRLGIKDNT